MYDLRNLQQGVTETLKNVSPLTNPDYDFEWQVFNAQQKLYMDISETVNELFQEFSKGVTYDQSLIDELVLMGISLNTAVSLAKSRK